jgi:hypothetical protein
VVRGYSEAVAALQFVLVFTVLFPSAFYKGIWSLLEARLDELARTEFIATNHIGVHPIALARFPQLKDPAAVRQIQVRMGNEDARELLMPKPSWLLSSGQLSSHPS